MLFDEHLVVVRGGGDLGTGVAYQLHRAGFRVVVLELPEPMAIRRTVAFATAVDEGRVTIEGIRGTAVKSAGDAVDLAADGSVAVLIGEALPRFPRPPSVVVDARVAKRNVDTTIGQAPLVVALGPGFNAGADCHAVIETARGHRLGRVIWSGMAEPDTGIPGIIGGASARRVVRAPVSGKVRWEIAIGDVVEESDLLGMVDTSPVRAPLSGVVRGLTAPRREVVTGLKIADIDPRADPSVCFEISDKSRLVGAGVLEAVLSWLNPE